MKKRYYIIISVISYLFFTLANIPAAKVLTLAESGDNQIPAELYGVYGSLWNGGADKIMMQGMPAMDNVKWSISPISLLLARLSGDIEANIKQQKVLGNVSISAGGSIYASDVRARIEAPVMQDFIQLPLGELAGTFNLNIQSLEYKSGNIPVINADIKWKNAQLTLAETVDLGHINLLIEPDKDQSLVAKISNKQGQLKLQGNALIDNNKNYTVNFSMTPDKSASDNVIQSIKMFARRQSNGSYQFKRKGNLEELGI